MSNRAQSATPAVSFFVLAGFAAIHWAGMVDPAPVGRMMLCVGIATAGALGLIATGRLGLGRSGTGLLATACGLATVAAGLVAVGIEPRLLWPGAWPELGRNLDAGLAGLAGDLEYPYRDGAAWSRLAILLVAPATLGLAATLAFWPATGRRVRQALGLLGLVALVALYATAVAATTPDGALVRGVVLLVLVGAWLWLPALRWREAAVAGALVAVAGGVAVPAAAELRGDPWLDYKNWTLRTPAGASYSWGHSYGPIDWPREGAQMLTVRSGEPHYWKTVVLDRFDGVRWTRSPEASFGARDVSDSGRGIRPPGSDTRWLKEFTVTVGDLESDAVISAGTPIRIAGIREATTAPDGTTLSLDEPLTNGDAYAVRAYIPDPTADELRAAPQTHPLSLAEHTRIDLPPQTGSGPREPLPPATIRTPAHGDSLSSTGVFDGPAAERIASSPYADVLELARSLTADQPTVYDSVRAIQDHLRRDYDYSEFPPEREYPLASFLLSDRRGYCQHFAGSMALMLRMAGIPSRVVSGFAPGTRTENGEAFRVEDLDAHAWVEVFFDGIGWVAFDPTPAAAPVSTQQVPGLPTSEVDNAAPDDDTDDSEEDEAELLPAPTTGAGGGSMRLAPIIAIPIALALALLGASALVAGRSRRHRRRTPALAAEAQLDELARALDRLGWPTAGGTTLLGIERSLRRMRRRAAARYVERVRAARYGGDAAAAPPSLAERRALRRELGSAGGLITRLRALVVIPPGGP